MATPIDPSRDPFAPPKTPCEVQCVHCGESYESWQIEWRENADNASAGGFWSCPTVGCDGIGFGFDIFPVDPAWTDENGEHLISQFADDDEDDNDEDDEEDGLAFDDENDAAAVEGVELNEGDLDAANTDVFDANSFWIDVTRFLPPSVGDSPQPPFNLAPPGKSSVFGDDDLPF